MDSYEDYRLRYWRLSHASCETNRFSLACNGIVRIRPPINAMAWILMALLILAVQTGLAKAQPAEIDDPTTRFGRVFGLGGHACKQYDDTGRLYIYTEGIPSTDVVSWLQRSDGGTRPNIPMPEELEAALPLIPGCLPGKHHAATRTG